MDRSDPGRRVSAMTLATGVLTPETHEVAAAAAEARVAGLDVPRHVARDLATGAGALGAGVLVERGLGFIANILAARLGGAETFGAYSLAITTAGNISTYAAGGIGATAARFSGKYPYGSAGYSTLARALLIVSLASSGLAACGLWLAAGPLAHLLHKDALVHLLHWAALSSAAIILLECARGFFTGQRRIRALLLLCSAVGVGMVALLPLVAAQHRPVRMILVQALVAGTAVALCLTLARPLRLNSAAHAGSPFKLGPLLREVWSFGFVQLAGLVGMNLSGLWLTTLVARDDTTLVQMSFFAIANQLRNIVGLGPSLLTESSYSIMAASDADLPKTPDQVMALCTFLSMVFALLLAGCGMLVLPWALGLLYGRAYAGAGAVVAAGLAVAVVHMGNAPAAARLTIVSLKTTAVVNTVWAVFVAAAATAALLHGGSAAVGMAVLLAAHVLSASLVLAALWWRDSLPRGVAPLFALGALLAVGLAVLGSLRQFFPKYELSLSLAMAALFACTLGALLAIGSRHRWLPNRHAAHQLVHLALARIAPRRVQP